MEKKHLPETVQMLINSVREQTGPAIPVSRFDDYPALPTAKTIRNKKSLGKIPADCFIHDGTRRCLVLMDKYLAYWGAGLTSKVDAT